MEATVGHESTSDFILRAMEDRGHLSRVQTGTFCVLEKGTLPSSKRKKKLS